MSLEPELRRKLSRVLTPMVVEALEKDLTASALTEMALEPGTVEQKTAEIVVRLRGIDYVCRQLAAIGIEPEFPLRAGGDETGERAGAGNGYARSQPRAAAPGGDAATSAG